MENKLKLNLVVKEDDTSSLQVRINMNCGELIVILLRLIDTLAEELTKNPLEKAAFLTLLRNTMENYKGF